MMTKQKTYIASFALTSALAAGVVIYVWFTHPKKPGSTSIKNMTTSSVTQSVPRVTTTTTLLTEDQAVTKAHIVQVGNENMLFYRDATNALQKLSLTVEGKENGSSQVLPDTPYGIRKEKIISLGTGTFFFYERNRQVRTEWILEKRSQDFHAQKTNVFAAFPAHQNTVQAEQYANAILIADEKTNTLALLTPITENTVLKNIHVIFFNTSLEKQSEKDLALPDISLFGTDFSAELNDSALTILFTEYRKGEPCPNIDKTTLTDIVAVAYQEQNVPVKIERLTNTQTIAHNPRVIGMKDGKIFLTYHTQRSQDPYPTCLQGNIPAQGTIHLMTMNTNLAKLNDTLLNDAKAALPGNVSAAWTGEKTMLMIYELARTRTADAKIAIIADAVTFSLETLSQK